MIRELLHVHARVFNVPLLIDQRHADSLVTGLSIVVQQRGNAVEPALEAEPPDGRQPRPTPGYRIDRGVATLPVRGVLVRRAGQIDADSTPLQSYDGIRNSLRAARSDSRVRGILLDIDSPGGEAASVFDLANEVRATTRDKPVWAIANDDSLSAAYVLAAAAQRLWITDTGAAGSLGVIALHRDQSAFDEKEGYRYHYVFRGAHKIDGNPHAPLAADATAVIQGEVDRLYEMLISNVAGHRGASPDRLRGTEANVYFGGNAIAEGLADQLGTGEQAHAAMAEHVAPISTRRFAAQSRRTDHMENEPQPAEENVVSFDQVHTAVAEARTQAGEVAAVCALAGYPELAAEAIKANTPVETLRLQLQQRKAADDAKRQIVAIDPSQVKPAVAADLHAAATARFAELSRPHNA